MAFWFYRELGFLEYLDQDIRQTKKGKVYAYPFHQTTARRKGRDHSIEILDHASRSNHLLHKSVDPMQIHGLNITIVTLSYCRDRMQKLVFVASYELHLTWASTFFMRNCIWWSLGAYLTVRPKQRRTFPYRVWVGNTYGIGSLSHIGLPYR